MPRLCPVLPLLALILAVPALTEAQTTGAIRGAIRDAQSAVLPGVTVTVTSPSLVRGSVSAVTDHEGLYRIPALQPGIYELKAELPSFSTAAVTDIEVRLEQEIVVNLTLQLATLQENVTVTGAPPTVDATVTGLRQLIELVTIDSMPINGRQFLDLVRLVPGTAPRPTDVEEGAGLTVLGGRSTTNGFLIDGMQNRDSFTGGFKEFFIQDAIQEFNVNVAGFQPEFGLASGGVVNIITRSGTNDFTGRAFLFARDDAFDSSNVPNRQPPALRRIDAGGTVGGPIVRDKAWSFYALENLDEARGINLDLSQVPPIIQSGFATPAFDGQEPFDAKPETKRFTQFVKVNQRLNQTHQYYASSNWNHNVLNTFVRPPGLGFIAPPAGSISLPSTASDVKEDVFSVNGRETAFLGQGGRWLLESTLRYARGDFKENLDRGGGATDEISLLAGGRFWNTNFPLVGAQKTVDSRLEWGEDLSYYRARHRAKFGIRVDRIGADGFYRTPTLNIIANNALESRFRDLGMDLSNQQSVRVLLPVDGREGYDITDTIFSAYAQDTWEVSNRLTINAGLRYDVESLFSDANKNVGPRLGLTWDPWGNGKTLFRASGGIYYDAGLLGPALLAPELGGSTIGLFSFWSMPRGGAFFNNPALGAFGSLHAGGTRWLANPTLFSEILPAGTRLTSGGITITGQGRPYALYELLGIAVPDPANPPVLSAESIPRLTGGRVSAQQALNLLNAAYPSPLGFPQFFYVPSRFAGQVMREGLLAFKFRTADIEQEDMQSIQEPFKTPYVLSYNVGAEREITGDFSMDVEYFRRNGNRLLARRVANLRDEPVSSSCLGNTTDGKPCDRQLQPIGFSRVNAVTVALRKRQSYRHSYLMSYTFTDATDNFNTLNSRGGGGNFNLNNRPELDIGRSLNTPEHVFVVSGSYDAPWQFQISSIFQATSGRPFNAAGLPVDSDGDANLDNRLVTTKKGEFETDPFAQLDLRVSKTFSFGPRQRLTLLVELFNVFNRLNPLQVNRAFGPDLGRTVEALPGREGQLGIRFDF